jgi:hypothetical protein
MTLHLRSCWRNVTPPLLPSFHDALLRSPTHTLHHDALLRSPTHTLHHDALLRSLTHTLRHDALLRSPTSRGHTIHHKTLRCSLTSSGHTTHHNAVHGLLLPLRQRLRSTLRFNSMGLEETLILKRETRFNNASIYNKSIQAPRIKQSGDTIRKR